ETDPDLRRMLLTFVVAGGGWSGVDVVAELIDFVRNTARQYASIKLSEMQVDLDHSGARVLEREVSEGLGQYAERILERRGVTLLLNSRLHTATPDAAVLSDGRRIESRTIVSTVPSSPHPLLETLDLPKERGRILVDGTLQVAGSDHIWAAGDCAHV